MRDPHRGLEKSHRAAKSYQKKYAHLGYMVWISPSLKERKNVGDPAKGHQSSERIGHPDIQRGVSMGMCLDNP